MTGCSHPSNAVDPHHGVAVALPLQASPRQEQKQTDHTRLGDEAASGTQPSNYVVSANTAAAIW